MSVDLNRVYTRREAYRRLYQYARRYRLMLIIGTLTAMLAGGTLFGVLQLIPLAMEHMGLTQVISFGKQDQHVPPAHTEAVENGAVEHQDSDKTSALVNKSSALTKYYVRVKAYAGRYNIPLETPDGRFTWQFIAMVFTILPLILVVRVTMVFANHYCLRWTGARVVRDLRNDMFDHLQNQSLRFFSRIEIGHLMSRCTNDTMTVDMLLSVTLTEALRAPFEILFPSAFIIYFAIQQDMVGVLLIAVGVLPLCMVPLFKLGQRVRKWSRRHMERISAISQRMHENLTGIRVVKAYHTEAMESERFHEVSRQQFKMVIRGIRAELLITPAMEAVNMLIFAVFLVYSYAKGLNVLTIVPIGAAFVFLYKPMKQLGRMHASVERGHAALNRIFSLLDSQAFLPEAANPVAKQAFERSVEFREVVFRYADKGEPVIHQANFEIRRGQMVAVVGSTGSGKSTLANLLARFYDPVSGSVLMDGIDLRELAIGDLRKLIGIVTQETILFNDTIAKNIAYGTPHATLEQIIAAAKLANAHNFIVANPEGYARVTGDKGFVLSGGERQRIAIARAILRNSPILVLDEATSALDTVTEQLVQEALNHLMANRTVFAIAHRLSTIRKADVILVLDKGRIVERGTHDALVQMGGLYRKLCDMQSSGQM